MEHARTMQRADDVYDGVISLLRSCNAHNIPHVKGTLKSHLEGTYHLLQDWGSPVELCVAGLCHAVYGTYDFDTQLLTISQRPELRRIVGPHAEGIVYLYAACDRPYVYPQIGRSSEIRFRDRF